YPDPQRQVDQWARAFVGDSHTCDTMQLLIAIHQAIKEQFSYGRREEGGTQAPLQPLELKTGSCRDFALFMMEAVRSLGFAARFVSGYLYDEALVDASGRLGGGGAAPARGQ